MTARHAHLYDRDGVMAERPRLKGRMIKAPPVPGTIDSLNFESIRIAAKPQALDDAAEKARPVWFGVGERAEQATHRDLLSMFSHVGNGGWFYLRPCRNSSSSRFTSAGRSC